MINKKKSSMFTTVKYLLVVPVGMALLLGNAVQATTSFDNFSIDEISAVMDGDQVPQKKDNVYTIVEQLPSFPGGEAAMQEFLFKNIKYPVEAQEKGAQGRVTVRFIVRSTGELTDIEILRGVDSLLDKETIRVIESMPKWEPGKQGGKVVDVYYTLPVAFTLRSSDNVETDDTLQEIGSINIVGAPKGEEASLQEDSPSDEEKPIMSPDELPVFPGGEASLQEFLRKNTNYPAEAQKKGIQGRVTIRFVVKSTGDISDIELMRGVDPILDKEALRVINLMPQWKPGKKNGEAVGVYFTLPINFSLPGKAKESSVLYVYDGKIISEDKGMEMVMKAEYNPKFITITVLEDAEGIKKYGKKAVGKRVIELKKN